MKSKSMNFFNWFPIKISRDFSMLSRERDFRVST